MAGAKDSSMKKVLLYIHGRGGSAGETEQFKPYCGGYDLVGLDFEDFTPWGTSVPIQAAFEALQKEYESVSILANSIGAYFAMLALQSRPVEKALFISPILNMEKLILDMMAWANVTEKELREKGEIVTDFGETLSWEYLCFVREHPIRWNAATEILYAEQDNMTSRETVDKFAQTHRAALTVMPVGEHWFHTPEQLAFLGRWLERATK